MSMIDYGVFGVFYYGKSRLINDYLHITGYLL